MISFILVLCIIFVDGINSLRLPKSTKTAASSLFPIHYRLGGTVLADTVNIYAIYYGKWTDSDIDLVNDFISNVGSSQWYKVNMKYYYQANQATKRTYVTDQVKLAGFVIDDYSLGHKLSPNDSVVKYHLNRKSFPIDSFGVYFLFTSQDVEVDGFCSQYCGLHDFIKYANSTIYYGIVANPVIINKLRIRSIVEDADQIIMGLIQIIHLISIA